MRLLIFGATRGCGLKLVEGALARGHEVTAFARDPAALPQPTEGRGTLRVVTGNALDAKAVDAAVAGAPFDAVLSALGGGRSDRDHVILNGTGHVVDAMRRHGRLRLLVVSSLGVDDRFLSPFVKHMVIGLFLGDVHRELRQMEQRVMGSGLNFTLVRPPRLLDGPATEKYRVQLSPGGPRLQEIRRADVAHFMLNELERNLFVGQCPAIGY